MATMCRNRHDHERGDMLVWISSKPGRKYHCVSDPQTCPPPGKVAKPEWRKGALAEANEAGIPQCGVCFGIATPARGF